MYFDPKVAADFAEHEQNEKNFLVADVVDKLVLEQVKRRADPLYVADLGAGAHPDRYHELFERLIDGKGRIDWVDASPVMLGLMGKYLKGGFANRNAVIHPIEDDLLHYLRVLPAETLDVAIMKYVLDHVSDVDRLFKLLSKRLKLGGSLVATLTTASPKLKSISTNARFLYRGKEFPETETRTLRNGQEYGIKFFKVSGDPTKGYIPGAETVKYYHSTEYLKELAMRYQFDCFIGDWKAYMNIHRGVDQDVLVLRKQ